MNMLACDHFDNPCLQVVFEMGSYLCSALLSQPWALGLFLINLETNDAMETPKGLWDRVLKRMDLSSKTVSPGQQGPYMH